MKRGFTLIELLVYMMIMGFIIVVAGRVYSDSTGMRVRTQGMTAAMEEANKVSALIKEDLGQMGAKEYANADDGFVPVNEVYMQDQTDYSSYALVHRQNQKGESSDSIAFKKIAFNADGEYAGVRLISWALRVDTDTLYRYCATIPSAAAGAGNDPEIGLCPPASSGGGSSLGNPIAMAIGVKAFALLPSTPGIAGIAGSSGGSAFGAAGFSLENRDASGEGNVFPASIAGNAISGFARNLEQSGRNMNQIFVADGGSSSCRRYAFKQGETYSLSFQTPLGDNDGPNSNPIRLFQPKKDHASVGFRDSNGEKIEGMPGDFLFYIPQTSKDNIDTMRHHFEFSASKDVSGACAMFTFAFYGPPPDGSKPAQLRIQDFKVEQKNEAYHFVREGDEGYDSDYATIDAGQKKKVKAFELLLEVDRKGEIGSTRPKTFSNGYVIPTLNNGVEL